jgi:hypothetical protein
MLYADVNLLLQKDLEGLMLLGQHHRDRMVAVIQNKVPIRPEDRPRWEAEELPKVTRLANSLKVTLTPEGNLHLSATTSDAEATMLSYQRGTSWFGAVDMIGVVNEALKAG